MCIFFAGGKSASDVTLGFIDIQHCPRLPSKGGIDLHEPGGDIFMYSRFTYSKRFGGLPHSGVIVDNIDSNIDRSFWVICTFYEAVIKIMNINKRTFWAMSFLLYNFFIIKMKKIVDNKNRK